MNNSTNPFPISGHIDNNGIISTTTASTITLCGNQLQWIKGNGAYYLNNLITTAGSDVKLARDLQIASPTTFTSTAVLVNGAQVLAEKQAGSIGLTVNNYLEGPGTAGTTPFATVISKMKMKTLRFGEGEIGDCVPMVQTTLYCS